MMNGGTIVDAAMIDAPGSTKEHGKEAHPGNALGQEGEPREHLSRGDFTQKMKSPINWNFYLSIL